MPRPSGAWSYRQGSSDQTPRLLVCEETKQVGGEGAEEDDGLLGGHRHACDLLVGERAGAPRPRSVHVDG